MSAAIFRPGVVLPITVSPTHQIRQSYVRCLSISTPDGRALQLLHLPKKPGYSGVALFGVDHETSLMEPADFILQHKPSAVVFENSFSASGGHGAVVSCQDTSSQDGSPAVTALCRLAAEMSTVADPQHIATGWRRIRTALDTEMLAHVAAFSVGADVIHADRPAVEKFQRLYHFASVVDLDEAIGVQSCINYSDILGQPLEHTSLKSAAMVYHIHIRERDAIMLHAVEQAASKQSDLVVGVVGADHLEGIAVGWQTSASEFLRKGSCNIGSLSDSSKVESFSTHGVRRALFERFFELSVDPGTCAAMQCFLPPLTEMSEQSWEAYELTREIYGSTRMMLACLSQHDLTKVCSGWECDAWELLAPLRAVRPLNGGSGFDEEVAIELRQLLLEVN